MVSFKLTKGIYFHNMLFNNFNNDNITIWSIYIYTCIYLKDTGIRWWLDVVLWAPLCTDLRRGRMVGLMIVPRHGWYGWHFNHGKEGKVGMLWCRHAATQVNTSVEFKDSIFVFYCIKWYKYIYVYHVFELGGIHKVFFLLKNTSGLLPRPSLVSLKR